MILSKSLDGINVLEKKFAVLEESIERLLFTPLRSLITKSKNDQDPVEEFFQEEALSMTLSWEEEELTPRDIEYLELVMRADIRPI